MKSLPHYLTLTFFLVAIPLYSQSREYKIMESFEDSVPKVMYAIGGALKIDKNRVKHGKQSLRWDWVGNGQLILNRDLGYHPQRQIDITKNALQKDLRGGGKNGLVTEAPRGLFLWIYNTKASSQRLRFQFGRGDKVDAEFDFNINFKGWRTVWIIYDKGDMMGTPHEDMDRMTILAPNAGEGTFYIDAIGTSLPMNFRQNTANPQLPNIDPHPRYVSNYEHRLYEWSKFTPQFETRPLTAEMERSLKDLDKSVEKYLLRNNEKKEPSNADLDSIRSRYKTFEIRQDGADILGRSLMSSNVYMEYFKQGGMPDKELVDEFIDWGTYSSLLKDIATAYNFSTNDAVQAEMTELFISMFDYGVDQGIDEGVGLSWIHHYAYRLDTYPPAIFLMREVLEKHNRRKKAVKILKWFFGFNQVYNEDLVYGVKGRKGIDADDAHGVLFGKFLSVMCMPNNAEKYRDLRHFSSFFSNVSAQTSNAIDDGIKPDGTAFHHAVHILSYGPRLVNSLTEIVYLLSETPFRASESAHSNVRRAVNTLFFIQAPNSFEPPTTYATTRFLIEKIPEEYKTMTARIALSGSPDGKDKVDKQMAPLAIHQLELALRDSSIFSKELTDKFHPEPKYTKGQMRREFESLLVELKSKISTTVPSAYNGIKVLPYSASMAKRNNDKWLASVRAHSKYVIPYESWSVDFFAYPLFIANGYLDMSYPEDIDSSTPTNGKERWHKGYDWSRWPGTTTVKLPFNEMVTMPSQVRGEGGEYLTSDQAFCGGVNIGDIGIFSFKLRGHDKYNLQSLRAKKSYFMFGDKIICIGSDIHSDIADYPVETTVFQDALYSTDTKTFLNDKSGISEFPYEYEAVSYCWLIDSRSTGYYIPKQNGKSRLEISRKEQSTMDAHAVNEVRGNFATALFNHGEKPNAEAYSYFVFPATSSDKMENFEQQMKGKKAPINILQQDKEAHIIDAPDLGLTGYVSFTKDISFDFGIVKRIENSGMVLLEERNGELRLNAVNPDLNIYDGQDDLLPDGTRTELSVYEREWFFWPSRPISISVTLLGKWQAKGSTMGEAIKITYPAKNETKVEFLCKDGTNMNGFGKYLELKK